MNKGKYDLYYKENDKRFGLMSVDMKGNALIFVDFLLTPPIRVRKKNLESVLEDFNVEECKGIKSHIDDLKLDFSNYIFSGIEKIKSKGGFYL
jgi:hypothetical protein